jgi:hypothetical protein
MLLLLKLLRMQHRQNLQLKLEQQQRQRHQAIPLKSGSKMYPLNYRITGSGKNLDSVSLEKDSSTLLLSLSSPSHGTLTVELLRNITDSKMQGTNHDQNYVVFEDSQYIPVIQLKNNTQLRTLAIDLTGVLYRSK